MDTIATCIGAFGSILILASSIALTIIGDNRDKNDSIGYWIDIWLFSAFFTSIPNFFRGFMTGITDRKSQAFTVVIIFLIGLFFVAASLILNFTT
jgi:hypothetical protein